MRPNQKDEVITAAVALAEEHGMSGVTLERAAVRAGMTKGGVLYHFPSKQALIVGIAEYLVNRCVQEMREALGVPFEDATPVERVRAYVRVVAGPGEALSRADAAINVEAWFSDEFSKPWAESFAPWFVTDPDLPVGTRARLDAVRLAADGLWLAEAAGVMPPADRAALIDHLLSELDLCEDAR